MLVSPQKEIHKSKIKNKTNICLKLKFISGTLCFIWAGALICGACRWETGRQLPVNCYYARDYMASGIKDTKKPRNARLR